MSGTPPFRDAERWLAERGIAREPISVPATDDAADPGVAPVGVNEARDAARQSSADQPTSAPASEQPAGLEDEVARALAFVRRSAGASPQAEGRLRSKLEDRQVPAAAIEAALERGRREGLVADAALAAALVEEWQAAGHAPARQRRDLRERGFGDELIEEVLAPSAALDQEAAAFAIAQERAARLTGLPAETAMRRVVGFVARRGYPEGLARKVAREAVFATREEQRTSSR